MVSLTDGTIVVNQPMQIVLSSGHFYDLDTFKKNRDVAGEYSQFIYFF
jgi:hypothetical protein